MTVNISLKSKLIEDSLQKSFTKGIGSFPLQQIISLTNEMVWLLRFYLYSLLFYRYLKFSEKCHKLTYIASIEIGNAATWDIEKDVKSIVKSPLRNCILFGSKNCSKIRKSGKSENRENQKIGEIGKSGKSGKSKNQEIDDVIKKSGNRWRHRK